MPLFADLVTAAILDPFRIVLLAGLVITQRRTADSTGAVLPLVAGVAFVALIIPMTMGYDAVAGLPMVGAAGIVANVVLLVPILAVARLWDRFRR